MKFLDITPLARLNTFFDHVDAGDYVVYGHLEAYSCKLAGLDKKLSRSLDHDVQSGSSPLELSMSPVGPLSESSSRRTLIYLILTLNNIYPDYDFSTLRAHHFKKELGISVAEDSIDNHLLEVSKVWEATPGLGDTPLLENLWTAIDEAINLKECDVYSYNADCDNDPFGEEPAVWAFSYLFYNRKMKRIVYLGCRAVSKAAADVETEEDSKIRYNTDEDPDYSWPACDLEL